MRPGPGCATSARGCVTLRELTVGYRERVAVEAVSGVFAAGSLTAIVGANGAGKTTLLHAIAGLVAPRQGLDRNCGGRTPRRSCLPAAERFHRPGLPDLGPGIRRARQLGKDRRPRARTAGTAATRHERLAGRRPRRACRPHAWRALGRAVPPRPVRPRHRAGCGDRPSRRAVRRRRRCHERRPAEAHATLAWRGSHGDGRPARPRASPRDLSGDPFACAQGDRLGRDGDGADAGEAP